MEDLSPILLVLLFLTIGVGAMMWTFSRARDLLDRWADDNGLEILSAEFRWLRRGPFFWTSSNGQMIYYVVVRTADGHTRRGWVRCGGFFWGLMQDRVEVRWDSQRSF